ncbi:MAG: L,D-transpeptidase family protein [Bacillota bacterium]
MSQIIIVLEEKKLYLSINTQLNNGFSIAIGKANTPTPTGQFSVINKLKNPYNPALGSRWIQFTPEMHGIHGTNQPNLIGQAISQGCVRMYNHNVNYLYSKIKIGTTIKIINSSTNTATDYFTYSVQPKDTLYNIAFKFDTTIKKIIELNHLTNKNLIYPGQQLKIPK